MQGRMEQAGCTAQLQQLWLRMAGTSPDIAHRQGTPANELFLFIKNRARVKENIMIKKACFHSGSMISTLLRSMGLNVLESTDKPSEKPEIQKEDGPWPAKTNPHSFPH
jgi:hypothetical protein